MLALADHEAHLTTYALERLLEIPDLMVYGDSNPERSSERLGVIPFNLQGYSHFLVAAILGHEYGIGVRNGCFCAHPYILHLLGLNQEEANEVRDQIQAGDRSDMPDLVRVSFGLYNSTNEIDELIESLFRICMEIMRGIISRILLQENIFQKDGIRNLIASSQYLI